MASEARPIQTTYYSGRKVVKITYAALSSNAVRNCTDHMQWNHYSATAAEVFDNQTGEVHAVVTRSVTGRITTIPKRELKEGM